MKASNSLWAERLSGKIPEALAREIDAFDAILREPLRSGQTAIPSLLTSHTTTMCFARKTKEIARAENQFSTRATVFGFRKPTE